MRERLEDFLDLLADNGWVFMGTVVVAFVLLMIMAGVGIKAANEAGCNQRADQLGVTGADYRFWSGTCYLTLENGRVVPADQYRAVEPVEGVGH